MSLDSSVAAISYNFKYCCDFVHTSYATVREIYIPSAKIIFNIDDSKKFNVFRSDESRAENTSGCPKIRWLEHAIEEAKTNSGLRKLMEEDEAHEIRVFDTEFSQFNRDVKNITLDAEFVENLKKLVMYQDIRPMAESYLKQFSN